MAKRVGVGHIIKPFALAKLENVVFPAHEGDALKAPKFYHQVRARVAGNVKVTEAFHPKF